MTCDISPGCPETSVRHVLSKDTAPATRCSGPHGDREGHCRLLAVLVLPRPERVTPRRSIGIRLGLRVRPCRTGGPPVVTRGDARASRRTPAVVHRRRSDPTWAPTPSGRPLGPRGGECRGRGQPPRTPVSDSMAGRVGRGAESYTWPLTAVVVVILPQILIPVRDRVGPPLLVPVIETAALLVLVGIAV